VIEAQPGGARSSPIDGYLGENTVWSNGYGITDPDVQRPALVAAAETLVGTPYGWGDIVAIALAQKRLGKWRRIDADVPLEDQPWWVRRLARTDQLICSELVDQVYFLTGIHLFQDGRPRLAVSPGDLGRLLGA
jgi:cell wall-associated NlpC family hydrolase